LQYHGLPNPRRLLHDPVEKVHEYEIKNHLVLLKKKRLKIGDDDPLKVCNFIFFHMFLFASVMTINFQLQMKLEVAILCLHFAGVLQIFVFPNYFHRKVDDSSSYCKLLCMVKSMCV